jgi:hypothetical protein
MKGDYSMSIDEARFSALLKQLLTFKTSITTIPIKDVNWEELIWATLAYMYGDDKVGWDPQSHTKSVDIVAEINGELVKISAKGGEIKNGFLDISSYRLTTYSTLSDMIEFISDQHSSFDYYLICTRQDITTNLANFVKYSVLKVRADRLSPSWFLNTNNWKETKSGYSLKDSFPFSAKIVFKMSSQLWYRIPFRYFTNSEAIIDFAVPKEQLGKGLINVLKQYDKK